MAQDEFPIINIPSYRRDLYQLLTLLLADEKVAMNANFKNLSESNHDNEVNRLLIWIAIATRQLLDIKNHAIGAQICGKFCNNFPHTGYDNLTFRTACNAIIHAVEILSYDPDDEEGIPEGTWKADYYKGTITVRGRRRARGRQQATRALLDCEKFVEYCIFLSEEFIEETY